MVRKMDMVNGMMDMVSNDMKVHVKMVRLMDLLSHIILLVNVNLKEMLI